MRSTHKVGAAVVLILVGYVLANRIGRIPGVNKIPQV
jgi:hypothetical protein